MVGELSWDAPFNVLHVRSRGLTGQGGLMSGDDPSGYNAADPLTIWIIQLGIIIMMAQLLSSILRKIKQPRIISDILAGILLGPSVFGRIPGFTDHIFPAASLPYLSLTAKIGLCLFLFIIGLEIDWGIIRRNARLSVVVSLVGVLLSFSIGCGISVAIYHNFIGPSTDFNYLMMFIAMSYSITAFPVLCRIFSTLKLRDTTVGVVVLSAAVANDAVGWTLLALAVAFVNTSSNLTALWTFLACMAYVLFLLLPAKWALLWLARKTRSTVRGPTTFYTTIVMLVLWGSAFFMDIIGVNAIFGAFVVGIIVPREGGVSIAFVERLEDVVESLFLPLYFTTSGLNTNLGLLNTGKAWGFLFVIVALDFTGKFTGCTLSSKAFGFSWREATAVGSLMSCKGLLGLIVLNVGLSAGILTPQVFSMFVLEALILAFMTTPLVNLIYPPKHRALASATCVAHTSSTGDIEKGQSISEASIIAKQWRSRFAVVLDEFDHMPGIMALTKLALSSTSDDPTFAKVRITPSVNALRLIELSERTSTMIKSAMTETLINTDPLLGVFKMFGEQSDIPVSASLSVVPQEEWASTVAEHAQRHGSQLILIPWIPPWSRPPAEPPEAGMIHHRSRSESGPLDAFFGLSFKDASASTLYSQFVRGVFQQSKTDVALFVDLGNNAGTNGQQHVLLPFFGGPDDRLALEFVVQLCANPRVSATIVRVGKGSAQAALSRPESAVVDESPDLEFGLSRAPTLVCFGGEPNSACPLQSEVADDLTWSRYASASVDKDTHPALQSALSRVEFTDLSRPLALHALFQRTKHLREVHQRVLVVVGRSMQFVQDGIRDELRQLVEEQQCMGYETVRSTIGDVGAAFVMSTGTQDGVIVVQAAIESPSASEI